MSTLHYPPRGRRPTGCVWNYHRGGWDKEDGTPREPRRAAQITRPRFVVNPMPLATVNNVLPEAVAPTPPAPPKTQSNEQQSNDALHEDKRNGLEDYEARKHATTAARTVAENVPVYYLDAQGILVQLGKERVRKPATAPPRRKRARLVQVQVWGAG